MKKKWREELRITNPPKELLKFVRDQAKKNKRTVPAQVEFMLEFYKNYAIIDG